MTIKSYYSSIPGQTVALDKQNTNQRILTNYYIKTIAYKYYNIVSKQTYLMRNIHSSITIFPIKLFIKCRNIYLNTLGAESSVGVCILRLFKILYTLRL